MASIPLPALSVRPPADPSDMVQKALALKGMIAQQQQQAALMPGAIQKQQQEIQAGALANQSAQQDMDARKALNQAYATSVTTDAQGKASFDPDKLQSTLATGPAAYKTPEVMKGIAEFQKTRVDLQNATQDLKAKQTDMIGGAASAVKAAGYDPTLAHSLLDSMPPSPQLDQIRGMIDSNPQGFKQMIDSAVAQSPKAAETAKNTAQAAMDSANAQKTTTENQFLQANGGMTAGMAESKYLSLQTKINQGIPVSPPDQAFVAAYEKNKTLVPQFNIKMQNSDGGLGPGGAGGGTGTNNAGAGGGTAKATNTIDQAPGILKPSIQAVLDYRAPMPPQGRANPRNNAIRDWVNKIDPTYDETTFPARNKILTEYVKSAGNGPIGAINTALGHLGELNEAAKALDQNDIPLLHSIASKVGAAVGGDAATTYTAILHRVGPEMTSAYVQGGGGQAERGANEDDFAVNKGQKQILSNIGESAKLLRSKMGSLENNWNQTFKPANDSQKFENRFITPQAKATLESVSAQAPGGGGSASFSVKAPNGKTYTFKDQASADAFSAKLPK